MNELQIFNNPDFGNIRATVISGEPYFVGKDVAEALGYSNTNDAILKHVDDEDKKFLTSQNTTLDIPNRGMTVINESGVYALVFSSKLPKAKEFKHWVTSEVLPTIRKHGAYMTPETLEKALLNPDGMIKVLQALKDEQDKRKALEAKNEEMKPKALFADAVASSDTSILMNDLAKLLNQNGADIGGGRLWKWMRDNGYIFMHSCEPTQKGMDLGLFEVIERTVQRSNHAPKITRTTKITGKGQIYFINKFKEDDAKTA